MIKENLSDGSTMLKWGGIRAELCAGWIATPHKGARNDKGTGKQEKGK